MVFEKVIEKLTTVEAVDVELARAKKDLAGLKAKRDKEIDQIQSNYVGGTSKIQIYIDELEVKRDELDTPIDLSEVDTKYPTASIEVSKE